MNPTLRESQSEERWVHHFAADIHSHLRQREKDRFPVYGRSKLLHLRLTMLEFLTAVSTKKTLCVPVQHLAAYLLDAYLDGNDIEEERWQMFVLGCLSLAVKLEENGDIAPTNRDLCKLSDGHFLPLDIEQVEICTLEYFKWDVLFPTAAHFAEYYGMYATVEIVDGLRLDGLTFELFKMDIHQYIEYFLKAVMHDMIFYNYSPSMAAAACVAASRLNFVLIPVWPKRLREITGYQHNELQPCIKILMTQLKSDRAKQMAQLITKQNPDEVSCPSDHKKDHQSITDEDRVMLTQGLVRRRRKSGGKESSSL